MEDQSPESLLEAQDHLDFPSLLVDEEAAVSPMQSPSPAATEHDPTPTSASPPTTSTSTTGTHDACSQDDRDKKSHKCPPVPTRMVTRSQTAAVRQPSYIQSPPHHISSLHTRTHRDAKDRQPSSCDIMDLSDEDEDPNELDDLPPNKNPARSGIDLGSVCPRCGAVLMTVTSRLAHNTAHGQEGAHCKYCQQVFITTHGRDAHQRLHGDARSVDVDDYCECALCGGAFISVMNLELHLLELHGRSALHHPRVFRMGISSGGEGDSGSEGGWALYQCGVCGQKFTYSFNLDCHMVLHTNPMYCCTICDASFPGFDSLMAHVRTHQHPTLIAPILHPPTSMALTPARKSQPLPGPSKSSVNPTSPITWGQTGRPTTQGSVEGFGSSRMDVPTSQAMLTYMMPLPMDRRGNPRQPCSRSFLYSAPKGKDSPPRDNGSPMAEQQM